MKQPRKGATNRELAEVWGITERQLINLRKRAPMDDLSALRKLAESDPELLSEKLMLRLNEFLVAVPKNGSGDSDEIDPDWEEFKRLSDGKGDDDPKRAMAALLRAREFASFKFEKAARENNKRDQKFYADLLAKFEGVLHDAQLRAKKLGIDDGELVPRAEVARIAYAMAACSVRCIDAALPSLSRSLLNKKFPKQVRDVLEPELLNARLFQPFVGATRPVSGQWLPPWFVEACVDAVDDYIEGGREMITAGESVADGGGI